LFVLLSAVTLGCEHKPAGGDPPAAAKERVASQTQSSEAAVAKPAAETAPAMGVVKPRPAGPIEFVDVTAQSGIRFKHNSGAFGKKYLPETMGSGVCFLV
jgi:hypothetical protein